jgi:hypothetical protein
VEYYPATADLKKADGVIIEGVISRDAKNEDTESGNTSRQWNMQMQRANAAWVGSIFSYLALLACAVVLRLVFPKFSSLAATTIHKEPVKALALGVGSLATIPIFAVLLFATILGIPLGMAVLMLFPVLLLLGYLVGVLYIAQRAQTIAYKGSVISFSHTIGFFAAALFLVMLMSRLPLIGYIVLTIITIVGTGACVLEIHRCLKAEPDTPFPTSSETIVQAHAVS